VRPPTWRQLIVFARAPQYGAVKTRLAAEIGAGAAWRAYQAMTATTLARLAPSPYWSTQLAVTPVAFAARGRFWPKAIMRSTQATGDLGHRMAMALAGAVCHGPTIIVGSDIPAITAIHIRAAFESLARHDVVFGPATDGGYWLVGVRQGLPEAGLRHLFDTVRWSSGDALVDTVRNVPSTWRIGYTPTLRDVDTAADLAAWLRRRA
jgi:rSAM/selenodomain-associated transferase 1